jgi:hypothetical protein
MYRDGPTGRRAALASGPDVSEVVTAVRQAPGRGDAKIRDAAEQLGLSEEQVRVAVDFATSHRREIERRIALNDVAAQRARELAERLAGSESTW